MTDKFPKHCKIAHITPVYKKVINWITWTTDQFH